MALGRLRNLASRRPLPFVVLLILGSLVVAGLAATLAVVLFGVDQTDPSLGLIGNLTATFCLVFLLWRFGWLEAAGIASWGGWRAWTAALVLLVYYLLELTYSFFGEFSFSVPAAAVSGLRVPGVIIGGMFEEVLFRGAVLYALVRVWGTTRTGVLRAASASALLFGLVHSANAIGGDRSEILGQMGIALLEGIWWAAIVVRWGSLWPTVLIHVVSNWVLRTKALGLAGYHGTPRSYALAVLLGLPLAAWGVWYILRTDLEHQREGLTSHE